MKANNGHSRRNRITALEQIRGLANEVLRKEYERHGLLKVGATEEEFDRVMARKTFGFGYNEYYGAPDEAIRKHYEKHDLLKVGATEEEFKRVKASEISRVGYDGYYTR